MITLASDFGTPYPAAMKGAILRRCDVRLVDIAHDFPRQDVTAAAFWLTQVLPEFPPAVHLVVVDPGVGTDRSALVVRAGEHVLVGPDNGVLCPPARALAGAGGIEAYEIAAENPRSATFHGRDVFAPAAASVHGVAPDRLPELDPLSPAGEIVDLAFPDPEIDPDRAVGTVLVVDGFGNVVTNVPGGILDGRETVEIDGKRRPVVPSYAHADPGTPVVTVGSHGNVECAVNRGRGEEAFGLAPGDTVRIGFE
ncbi:SAM-dependent chlorinase/fluorinase [Natronomonas sp. F2-12]|jgi:S-adenosylmethionine hydrolase|uniref:SAM-dependent chlorinase/fluorinase n=1 Tax=Natronomonas aquatica TaxID=2841590 RepID=A0A9R1CR07_9EURY|nr:SAM-dependent chlorinase/fluorinase [Natronomonas aquatica]MCQ4332151.1 SAM-dependent chlorinase/fluorinase [Natronomonas aquatica]